MDLVNLFVAFVIVFIVYFIYKACKKRDAKKAAINLGESLNSRRSEALCKLSRYIDIRKEADVKWHPYNVKDIRQIEDAPEFSEAYLYMNNALNMDFSEFLNAMFAIPETVYMTQMLQHKKLYSRFVANGMWHEFYKASVVMEPLNYFMEPKSACGLRRPDENMHDVATAARIADRLNAFMWNYMVWYEKKLKELDIDVTVISTDPFNFDHAVSWCFSDVPCGDTPENTVLVNRVVEKPERRVAYFVWESRLLRHGPFSPYAALEHYLQHDKSDTKIVI